MVLTGLPSSPGYQKLLGGLRDQEVWPPSTHQQQQDTSARPPAGRDEGADPPENLTMDDRRAALMEFFSQLDLDNPDVLRHVDRQVPLSVIAELRPSFIWTCITSANSVFVLKL